jgi:hypothetical protein
MRNRKAWLFPLMVSVAAAPAPMAKPGSTDQGRLGKLSAAKFVEDVATTQLAPAWNKKEETIPLDRSVAMQVRVWNSGTGPLTGLRLRDNMDPALAVDTIQTPANVRAALPLMTGPAGIGIGPGGMLDQESNVAMVYYVHATKVGRFSNVITVVADSMRQQIVDTVWVNVVAAPRRP